MRRTVVRVEGHGGPGVSTWRRVVWCIGEDGDGGEMLKEVISNTAGNTANGGRGRDEAVERECGMGG